MDICGDEALFVPLDDCECPDGGGPAIRSVTWAQLKALRDGSDLVPGTQYRIIDYECTTTQAGTTVGPHPFDLIVTADSESTLNENARAIKRKSDSYYTAAGAELDAWEIKYSLDNDTSRFAWADPVNGTGVIYFMKDEHGNEAPYDFKQIMFARYQVQYAYGHGGPIDSWATPTMAAVFPEEEPLELDQIPTYFYTFSFEDNGVITDNSVTQEADCFENIIRAQHPEVGQWEFGTEELPDVVFIETTLWRTPYNTARHGTTQNTLGAGCHDLTFSASTHNNTLGENVRSSMFMSQFVDNTIGDYCYGLFLGHTSNDNVIGASSHSFIWDGYHISNVTGPWCANIYLAPACSNNTFDSNCAYIELGGYSGSNMFHSDCWYIEVPGTASHNNFGLDCYRITSASGLANITFGSDCSYIDLGIGVRECSFGNDCDYIELQDGIIHSTFEDGVRYVRVNTAGTGWSHHVQNYYFLTGTQGEINDYIEINGVLDNNFTTYVGRKSDGTLREWNPADESGGITPQIYQGPINVTPMVDTVQTLSTAGMLVEDDITVQGIPYTETPNAAGGTTLTIG